MSKVPDRTDHILHKNLLYKNVYKYTDGSKDNNDSFRIKINSYFWYIIILYINQKRACIIKVLLGFG
jgi:hypothetical protein